MPVDQGRPSVAVAGVGVGGGAEAEAVPGAVPGAAAALAKIARPLE